MYKSKVKRTANNFVNGKINKAKGQKEMWKVLKSFVLGKPEEDVSEAIFNGERCTNEALIADKFNRYFVESINEINSSIPLIQYDNTIEQIQSEFKFREIRMEELYGICREIKNKRDVNLLNIKMILDGMDRIGPVLLNIINRSMMEGTFPKTWKTSVVVPVPKVKNSKRCEDFRPINMLETQEKILEKVVQMQLETYLEKNKLISEQQSGFRKGHSCETALNWVLLDWKQEKYKGNCVVAVFLDLKRAFETVDRTLLLKKLVKYGIDGKELEWFRSYLTQRTQKTKINDIISEAIEVLLGVPQGSVLGTLLFLVYVNDVVRLLRHSKIILFADDALIYIAGESADECVEDLRSVNMWLKMNR